MNSESLIVPKRQVNKLEFMNIFNTLTPNP